MAFLVFFSEHEATSPYLMLLWLNPLQFLVAIGVWFRSWRLPLRIMAVYDIVAVLALTLLLGTPLASQVANPAVWPMLWSMSALSLTLILSSKHTTQNAKRKTQNA